MNPGDKPQILISCHFPRSVQLEGVGTLAAGLAEHLAAHGWTVSLLLPEGHYRLSENIRLLTYRSGVLGLGRYKAALSQHSQTADAVLAIENNPNMGLAAQNSRCPHTFSFFCTPLQSFGLIREMGLTKQSFVHCLSKHWFWSRLQDWSQRQCLVSSEYQAQQLRQLGAANVRVLPVCGVSCHTPIPPRAQARQQLGWDEQPVVGYLGHFSTAKGVDVLISAFAEYSGPGVLALAHSGKGRLRARSIALLRRMESQGRVRLLGVTDVSVFLAGCDAIALPYVTSSIFHQPQVLLESFAASTPVITTSLGGFAEMVRPGQTGWVIPPRDHVSLSRTIKMALSDLAQAHQMGHNARLEFERSGSLESFVTELSRRVHRDGAR